MDAWSTYVDTIANGLRQTTVTDRAGATLSSVDGYNRWVALTHATKQRDGQIFIIGNGGSAAMASHMAIDACKNGHLRALALNDVALITAVSNDLAYDQVFRLPLERLARRNDMLITISSSGNSPNVVAALEAGRAIGMQIVTLSAKQGDNQSRRLGDLNFYVPLHRYGWAESAHQIVLHHWFDQYLDTHRDGAI
jgi:D-sedoheptulose 7-phosphate isomerase